MDRIIREEGPKFIEKVLAATGLAGFDVSKYEMDHICYRTETKTEYLTRKQELGIFADLLIESIIAGRLIATYKLKIPLVYEERKVWLVELPSPKTGSDYKSGFEHVEFVVDIKLEGFLKLYPNHEWKFSGFKKSTNRDVRLDFVKVTDPFSIKFHESPLEKVIEIEKAAMGKS